MPELIIILFLAILLCAVYGFISLIMKCVRAFKPRVENRDVQTVSSPPRSMDDDVVASSFLLNHLHYRQRISQQQYDQLRDLIESDFGTLRLAERIPIDPTPAQVARTDSPVQPQRQQTREKPAEHPPRPTTATPPAAPQTARAVPSEAVAAKVVMGEIVHSAEPKRHSGREQNLPTTRPLKPAPWDLPDPPTPKPRRKLADMLAGFMEEKNIRWGELASGILIIGSAIGLVISLRNELNETIPYFPALMFLLITAAIHAAGAYTLKRWKLQNTSRGTLLIGLLLIPLNFLAACVLTGSDELRKPLTDPIYWLAVITGLLAYGFMTWWSSRTLLRRGFLPLVFSLMGAGVMTLVINRMSFTGTASWPALVVSSVVAVITGLAYAGFWFSLSDNRTLSARMVNRLFMVVGLSVFAYATAVSLILIRAADPFHAVIAISPSITLVSMLTAGMGASIHARVRGSESITQKIVGRALMILGCLLVLAALVVSSLNPTMLVVNGILAAAMLWLVADRERVPWLLPAAWASLATTVITAAGLLAGEFRFDTLAGVDELLGALVSGRSGISLMSFSAALAGLTSLTRARPSGTSALSERENLNRISAAAIAAFGCLLALLAGLLNRDSVFDTMTASVLLLLSTLVTGRLSLTTGNRRLTSLFAILVFAFCAFSLIWNPTTSAWIEPLCFGLNAKWPYVFSLVAIVTGLTAVLSTRSVAGDVVSVTTREFGVWSAGAAAAAVAGGLYFVNSGTGLSPLIVGLVVIALAMVAWSHRRIGRSDINYATPFVLSTGLLLTLLLYEFAPQLGLPAHEHAGHWLWQCIALAAWSTAWTWIAIVIGRSTGTQWVIRNQVIRGDQLVLGVVVAVIVLIIGSRLFEAAGRELDDSFNSFLSPIGEMTMLSTWAIAMTMVGIVSSLFYRSHWCKALALVALYVTLWSVSAAPFDGSRSVATAVRWLVPLGALVAASSSFAIKPFERMWSQSRQRLSLVTNGDAFSKTEPQPPGDRRSWSFDILLFISAAIVLTISSIATAQVLMTEAGVDALGGPLINSWFAGLRAEINYGVPGAMLTTAMLLFAISLRRSSLAFAGSAVYQYFVLFAIAMLFLSVHPALATTRFVQTLQVVSLGMTGYGLVWYWQRNQIGNVANIALTRQRKVSQLELHTLINALLVTSLACLIGGRLFFRPDQSIGWIHTAGGPLGMIALVSVAGLAYQVGKERLAGQLQFNMLQGLTGWAALVFAAMLAAIVDRSTGGNAWIGFRVLMWGSITVAAVLCAFAAWQRRNAGSNINCLPGLLSGLIGFAFALRGTWSDGSASYQYLVALLLAIVTITAIGLLARSAWPSLVAAAAVIMSSHALATVDPGGWYSSGVIDSINLSMLGLVILSIVWSLYSSWRFSQQEAWPAGFAFVPNVVLLGSTIWVLAGSLLQWAVQSEPKIFGGWQVLAYPWGVAATLAPVALAGIHSWNPRRRFPVVSFCLWSLGASILCVAVVAQPTVTRNIWVMFVAGLVVASWGIGWLYRDRLSRVARTMRIPELERLQQRMAAQLPVYTMTVGVVIFVGAALAILFTESRPLRYLTALTPLTLAVSMGCQSDPDRRRWMQRLTLVLIASGCLFAGWADLRPIEIQTSPVRLAVRTLLVLAGAMFVYGVLISRWVRSGDTWLTTLREMAVVMCMAAVICLVVLVGLEAVQFDEATGCGLADRRVDCGGDGRRGHDCRPDHDCHSSAARSLGLVPAKKDGVRVCRPGGGGVIGCAPVFFVTVDVPVRYQTVLAVPGVGTLFRWRGPGPGSAESQFESPGPAAVSHGGAIACPGFDPDSGRGIESGSIAGAVVGRYGLSVDQLPASFGSQRSGGDFVCQSGIVGVLRSVSRFFLLGTSAIVAHSASGIVAGRGSVGCPFADQRPVGFAALSVRVRDLHQFDQ